MTMALFWQIVNSPSDPILKANDLRDRGRKARARQVLERLIIQDVRCLDAHAHVGNLGFASNVRSALWHYERGMLIGQVRAGLDWSNPDTWPGRAGT
jgi:hypothetical protein